MVYLIHLPTYVVVQLLFVRFFGSDALMTNSAYGALCGLLAAAGAFGLAGLSWRYFEGPIMRLKDAAFPIRGPVQSLPTAGSFDQTRVCA
jgi:peptidoglycan/LPS O-acetylase OafA/YrhL